MKISISIFIAMLYAILGANAIIVTVSNNPAHRVNYQNLQKALDECALDDTVFVYGSANNYGDITIRRRITLMGEGYNPRTISKLAIPS